MGPKRSEDGEGSSRGGASKRGKVTQSRRDPNTLPYSCFWDNQGHTNFYEDQVLTRTGRNDEPVRIIAGNDRTLCPAHALKLDFLVKHHFNNIARMLEFQGWEFFLGLALPHDPSMIKQFYHNLKPRNSENETGHFICKIYGNTIDVTSKILASYFAQEDSLVGAQLDGTNFGDFCVDFDITRARVSMLEPGCRDLNSILVSDFSIENRLLFHILTKVIVPRSGSFTKATDFDIGLMYFIRNHIKICLGDLMFTHILGGVYNKNRACAYLMPLTHFFINECHVPTNPNNAVHSKQMWYDEKMLKLLFTKNERTGFWGRKYTSRNLVEQLAQEPNIQVPLENPNIQSHNPNVSQEFPSSSSNLPSQSSYDPFLGSYNPSSYQSDMFSMMQSMHSTQMEMNSRSLAFENETRASFTHIDNRLNEQDRNIDELNDAIAKMMRDYPHY